MPLPLPPFHDDPAAAPCRGKYELFCSEARSDLEQAKVVCRGCPQRTECFAYGLAIKAEACVFGGVIFPDEARSIMRSVQRRERERAKARRVLSAGAPAHLRRPEAS